MGKRHYTRIIKFGFIWLALISLFAITACSGKSTENAQSDNAGAVPAKEPVVEKNPDPVTIRVFTFKTRLPEADFKMLFTDPVKAKYPHITVEPIYGDTANREQVILYSDVKPDLLIFWNGEMNYYQNLDILRDMRPLFQTYKFDLNRFQDGVVGTAKGNNGEIYGLPYNNNVQMLYYNKGIFDKFGVPYPKDGLFWEDVVELAKKMTRTDGGVEYRGYNYDFYFRLSSPLSLAEVDDKTMKSTVNTNEWKKALSMIQAIHEIPGIKDTGNYRDNFIKKQNLAMTASVNILHLLTDAEQQGLSWDIAQYPSWKDRPNMFGYADLHEIGLTKMTKHEDAAMKVMEVFLSDEVQLQMARKTGRVSPLKGKQFAEQYGADVSHLKGKNVAGIFKSKPAPIPSTGISRYWGDANPILQKHVNQMIAGEVDVNTALMRAEEEINKMLDGKKAK